MRKKALQVRGQVAQKWPPWESRGALVYDDLGRIWKNSKEFERIRKNLEEFSGCLIFFVSASEFFSLFLLQIFTVNSFEISFCEFWGLVGGFIRALLPLRSMEM